ncbi:MAG: hypothetical protein WBO68_03140 [Pyrinomonadaceae bacterium]
MSNLQYESGAINASDCYGNAWSLVTNKFGLYLGVGIVTMLMIGCIPLVSLFLVGPIMGGFYFLALKDMRGEPVDFGMMFKGFDKFVPLMVIGLIQSIPGVIFQIIRFSMNIGQALSGGSNGNINFFQSDIPNFGLAEGISIVMVFVGLAFAIISIVWSIALQFAIPIALENDIGAIEAIKLSMSAAVANLGGMILLILLGAVAAILGTLALCLGLFVAIPVIWVANAFAYRQVFPLIDRQFNMSPPPPNAYGSSFGSGMQ